MRRSLGDDDTDVSGCQSCGDQRLSGDGERVLAMAATKGDQFITNRVVPTDEVALIGRRTINIIIQ